MEFSVMDYHVVAWITALAFSLTVMVFVTTFCQWCHKSNTEDSSSEREPLMNSEGASGVSITPASSRESTNKNDHKGSLITSNQRTQGRKHTPSTESGIATASERNTCTSISIDMGDQASLPDTAAYDDDVFPSKLEGASQKEDHSEQATLTDTVLSNGNESNDEQHTCTGELEQTSQSEDPVPTSDLVVPDPQKSASEPNEHDATDINTASAGDDSNLATLNQEEGKSEDASKHSASNHLDESHLGEVLDETWNAKSKWYQIGLKLGLLASDLDSIQSGPNGQDPEKCFTAMLAQWLRNKEATWEALINALSSQRVGYSHLASSIRDKMCPTTKPSAERAILRKSEEGGVAFKCKCGRDSIMEYLDGKCPCSAKHFPFLDYGNLNQNERRSLDRRLLKDTKVIVSEFADLLRSMRNSLKTQQLDPKEIVSDVLSIDPSTAPSSEMLDVASICDVVINLQRNGYVTFFNYHIVQYLIESYGTPEDKQKLDEYIAHFQEFCQRSVFEVPQRILQTPTDSEKLAFKVMSTRQWISLGDVQLAQLKVAEELGLRSCCNLPLIDVAKGCVVLTFALPQVVMDSVKSRLDRLSSFKAGGHSIHILCGPPGKPVATRVTSDSITLKWTKPEYGGTHSLTHYWISYHSVTDPREEGKVMAMDECVTVEGLSHKGASSFVFRVKAYSKIEAGVESRESDPIELSTPLSELKFPLKLEWTTKSKMSFGISTYPQVVVLKEKVYIGGGNSSPEGNAKTVIVYNPEQDKYDTLTPYTHKHFAMTTVVDNLVLVGGENSQDDQARFTNQLAMWNGESNEWTHPLPPMTTPCKDPSVTTYKDKWLIVVGGFNGDIGVLSRVEVLDISSQQWSISAPMPTPCNQLSLATVGNMCYLLGGFTEQETVVSDKVFGTRIDHLVSQEYSNTISVDRSPWQVLPKTPGQLATALALNGALLAVGGRGHDIYMYQPSTQSWVEAGALHTARSACGCAVLSSGEVIVVGGGAVGERSTIGRLKTDQKVDIAIYPNY